MLLGKQKNGSSSSSIKKMATKALRDVMNVNSAKLPKIIDVGSGNGELCPYIERYADLIVMLDSFKPDYLPVNNAEYLYSDLNNNWSVEPNSADFVFSLEVIEHIENPRHFFRELNRIIRPGGYGFVSTPNNENLFSKINFFLNGEHRWFSDNCYPAHISALLRKDFKRILNENNLELIKFYYNYEDVIPRLGIPLRVKSHVFSNSVGVLFKKPSTLSTHII